MKILLIALALALEGCSLFHIDMPNCVENCWKPRCQAEPACACKEEGNGCKSAPAPPIDTTAEGDS